MNAPQTITFLKKQTCLLLEEFYRQNYRPLLDAMDSSVLLIGEKEGEYLRGKEAVASFFSQMKLPASRLIRASVQNVFQENTLCILAALYFIRYRPISRITSLSRERGTFVWHLDKEKWAIRHVHLSLPSSSLPLFSAKENWRTFIGTHGEKYFQKEEDILYIEAFGHQCQLHCKNEKLDVCGGISAIEESLSSCFLRIHRSFLVNKTYVVKIQRYRVTLSNQEVLPIPEKKYVDVKQQLLS